MRVFITGGNGLVGKNIVEKLTNKGFEIYFPGRKDLDILKYTEVDGYINIIKPDIVIHCAGKVGGIAANIKEPVEFLIENVDMARNVILAAKNNNVKKLINLGSSCMYPRLAPNPLKEEFILTGELEPTNEGYAIAKIFALKLCNYINQEFDGFNYKTIIPCNLYGKYDKFDPEKSHMIPSIIMKIYNAIKNNEKKIEIWGDGNARREFLYVEDLADFILFSINEYEKIPSCINFGLGFDYSVNDYYRISAEVCGYKGEFIHNLNKPVGMAQKLVDISRLKSIGWNSFTSLEKGIQKTFEYYKSIQ